MKNIMKKIIYLLIVLGLMALGTYHAKIIHDEYDTTQALQKPFTSDGCTLFPDWYWGECCTEHDKAYWNGGSIKERKTADKIFEYCIYTKTKSKEFSKIMYYGVRLGGSPYAPTRWRWGFGWEYGMGYHKPITVDTETTVDTDSDL